MAIRPKTLWAAVAPVLIGTAMACTDGRMHFPSALAALIGALLIQIETNLANDYFDFKKGTDTQERIGPTRVMQAKLVTPKEMKSAIIIVLALSILICLYLIVRGGWPIVIIGVLSLASAFLYTAGPKPLGYLGLGDVFVFIFFGPVAVAGTYYVQALSFNPLAVVAGFAPGFLSVAILTVNNLRDIDSDRKAGKKTLAVRFGRGFALMEYYGAVLGAASVPAVIFLITKDYGYSLTAILIAFFAIPTIKIVFTKTDGPSLNRALANTGKLLWIYSLLFSVGWIL